MEHMPVLLGECIEGLAINPCGIYVDGTLGRGGHTEKIAEKLTTGHVYAIDRDGSAIEKAGERLRSLKDKITLIRGNFSDTADILVSYGVGEVDGMLFDLGVSSPQLDDESRGFAYSRNTDLDMRMDLNETLTAFDVVNGYSEEQLRKILFEYGEERYGGRIARAIIKKRDSAPIKKTFELNDVILSAIPSSARHEKQHPSKRSFQAIRIAVNDELSAVSAMLDSAPDKLKHGGRICVISFHSLEDRLVKNAFNSRVRGCTCPPDFPVCVCGFKKTLRLITKKPILPAETEVELNPRSRSAKLRIAEWI